MEILGKETKRPATTLPLLLRDKGRQSLGLAFRPSTTAVGQGQGQGKRLGRVSLALDLSDVPIRLKEKLESFRSYRTLPKVVEMNKYQNKPNEPHVDYFLTLEKEGVSPRAWGVLRKSYAGGDIMAQHYYLGKRCAHALANSLDNINDVEKVMLQGNKLSSDSSVKILKRLHSKNTRELDMSDNHLGFSGISEISELVSSIQTTIKLLHLENCKLGMIQIDSLCQALSSNLTVKELSLARNHLGESAAFCLGEMVQSNERLIRLDLHWNNLRAPGALKLMEGLKLNDKLREVDLSWNSLSQGDTQATAQAISNWLFHDNHVRHLDLSFNYMPASMWEVIQVGLKDNHTLVGLHVFGNYCEIDSRGFVTPSVRCEKTSNALISPRILKHKPSLGNKCWICEKWVEVTITVEDASLEPPIFVHFEFEGFEPELMKTEGWKHSITRAIPPGRPRLFLSTLKEVVNITDLDAVPVRISSSVTYYEGKTVSISLAKLYWVSALAPAYTPKHVPPTEPRIPKSVYNPPIITKEKPPWSLPISLFKNYRFTTEKLIGECFEFDWKSTRIPKIIKDPVVLEACKTKLKSCYKVL